MHGLLNSKWTKVLVFLICLLPLASLAWRGFHNDLTANPIEFITHATGDWTLRFLVFTLCITPFRKILRLPELIRFRRMLGLFAFFYACLHFTTYIWLDKFFDLAEMWKDIAKRKFITVGFTAFVLLIPLALTSTAGWIRRLGGKRWQMLHRLIYVSAVAGRDSLLLAGEIRGAQAAHVWSDRCAAVVVEISGIYFEEKSARRAGRQVRAPRH